MYVLFTPVFVDFRDVICGFKKVGQKIKRLGTKDDINCFRSARIDV